MPKKSSCFFAVNLLLSLLWLAYVFVPWSSFYSGEMSLRSINLPISVEHPFGTDHLGRDLLVVLTQAFHQSIFPLWATVAASTLLGFGLAFIWVTRSRKGRLYLAFDSILFAVRGVFLSIPIGITVFILSIWMGQAGIVSVLIAGGVFCFLRSFGVFQQLFNNDNILAFWVSHQAMGGGLLQRVWNYGVKVAWAEPLIQTLIFNLSILVSIEAALSYLGFGVQPPKLSIGNIISAHYSDFLKGELRVMVFAVFNLAVAYIAPILLLNLLRGISSLKSYSGSDNLVTRP